MKNMLAMLSIACDFLLIDPYSCSSLHLLASKYKENSLYGHIEIGKMNKAPFIDMNNAMKHYRTK